MTTLLIDGCHGVAELRITPETSDRVKSLAVDHGYNLIRTRRGTMRVVGHGCEAGDRDRFIKRLAREKLLARWA